MRRGCDVNDVIQYRTKIHNSQNIMIAVDRSFDAIFDNLLFTSIRITGSIEKRINLN